MSGTEPGPTRTSYQACATKITIQMATGGADVIGYCRKPLFHSGPHDIYATASVAVTP